MSLENYLKSVFIFAQNLEIENNFSRFEYQNQPFQCGKNSEGFWLMASAKEKDTPACFECNASLYDDEEQERLEEMCREQAEINQSLANSFPNLKLVEQDNFFKLLIEYTEEEFLTVNFENDCKKILAAAKSEQVRMFRNQFESQY